MMFNMYFLNTHIKLFTERLVNKILYEICHLNYKVFCKSCRQYAALKMSGLISYITYPVDSVLH